MARYLSVRVDAPPAWLGAALLVAGLALAPGAWSDPEDDAELGDVPSEAPQVLIADGSANALGAVTLRDPQDAIGSLWRVVVESGQLEITGTVTAAAGAGVNRLLVLRAGR